MKTQKKNPQDDDVKIKKQICPDGKILYTIHYYDEEGWGCIGVALYDPKLQSIENVDIDKYFRSKGLGTYLYDYIEADQNIKLKPYHFQSPQGKAFWKNRLRKNPIKASEAYGDKASLQTVIKGKRNIAFIIPKFAYKKEAYLFKKLKENNLNYLETNNPDGGIIIFRNKAKNNAFKLQKFLEKGKGYLLSKYSKEIGKLLEYENTL